MDKIEGCAKGVTSGGDSHSCLALSRRFGFR